MDNEHIKLRFITQARDGLIWYLQGPSGDKLFIALKVRYIWHPVTFIGIKLNYKQYRIYIIFIKSKYIF